MKAKIEQQQIEARKYEIAFVLKAENSLSISAALKSKGFSVLLENPIEKIQLAYPIKKENYAYFGYFHFEGNPAEIKSLKDDLALNHDVLRYIIITPPFVKKPAWRRPMSSSRPSSASAAQEIETKASVTAQPALTNEALEKKIEEILK